MTYEKCSCGASIFTLRHSRALDWRASHLHDFEPPVEEMPVVHESVSSHERSYAYIGEELRAGRT